MPKTENNFFKVKDIIKINNNKNTYCDDDIKNIDNSEKSEDINLITTPNKFILY